jgi:hypothetical protein
MSLASSFWRMFSAVGRQDFEFYCAGDRRSGPVCDRGRIADSGAASKAVDRQPLVVVCEYRSETEFSERWHEFDRQFPGEVLTTVLVLDGLIRSGLRGLVRRRNRAWRLIVVPQADTWPGADSFGDVALAAAGLGWEYIELCRDVGDALAVASRLESDERVLIFVPASLSVRAFM